MQTEPVVNKSPDTPQETSQPHVEPPEANRENEVSAETENTDEPAGEDSSSVHGIFSQQFSASEGGMPTDMYCPGCGEEISGSYLPVFRSPCCGIQIWRDDKGIVTNYEQQHTCPACGHIFNELTDEAATEFRRTCRNFEQKVEGVFLGLDRIVNRMFS